MRPYKTISAVLLLAILVLVAGCGDENNPIAAFEPEVVNNPDAFEFQITDASDVSTVLSYTWVNTGVQASIDHSTVTTAGSASVEVFDANSLEVYSSDLLASGTEPTISGVAGDWTVRVTFDNFDGTVNFRVQRL